jgi:DNA invertase Pin-like site-specific DNA recombinase
MIRCAVYTRAATDAPASIMSQLQACAGFAKERGWVIVDTYSDVVVVGTLAERPALSRLLAETRHFAFVIVADLDRLARSITLLAHLNKILRSRGVQIVPVAERRRG